MDELLKEIDVFFEKVADNSIEIYNEFSLQHELGIYLRQSPSLSAEYKIQFERPVTYFGFRKAEFVKTEIDIVIFNHDQSEKYAIELKYPRNGQHPEQMFQFCKDICFIEQLVYKADFTSGYFLVVVDDERFYKGDIPQAIYEPFRGNKPIHGKITKPTGSRNKSFQIDGSYHIKWEPIKGTSFQYAILSINKQSQLSPQTK